MLKRCGSGGHSEQIPAKLPSISQYLWPNDHSSILKNNVVGNLQRGGTVAMLLVSWQSLEWVKLFNGCSHEEQAIPHDVSANELFD